MSRLPLILLLLSLPFAGCGASDCQSECPEDDATTPSGDDDASSPQGDDDGTPGDDDASSPQGDDDATPGDDDASSTQGDDDGTPGDDDASSPQGDDDATPGDDDASSPRGDDDATDDQPLDDADEDGFTAEADCDDADASVYPGAVESCNGRDDDCNGAIDEELLEQFYRDADGDGYGTGAVSTTACAAPSGYVSNTADCDDGAGDVHPGAVDAAVDFIDEDCDGNVIETVVGTGLGGYCADGTAALSCRTTPTSIVLEDDGTFLFSEDFNGRVRRFDAGILTTVAGVGTGGFSGDGGPATAAELSNPLGLALDGSSNLLIADAGNQRVRRVHQGVIETLAGNGLTSDSGDGGPATLAGIHEPLELAIGPDGSLYLSDLAFRVRRIKDGVITTFAGTGTQGFSGDGGPATEARLTAPQGLAFDATGDLYIADSSSFRIRRVRAGIITTMAGNGQYEGDPGDGGPATDAVLSAPYGVAFNAGGDLLIAEQGRIRVVRDGIIGTVAGTGRYEYGGDDGPATAAGFGSAVAVAAAPDGSILIVDRGASRIRRVTP